MKKSVLFALPLLFACLSARAETLPLDIDDDLPQLVIDVKLQAPNAKGQRGVLNVTLDGETLRVPYLDQNHKLSTLVYKDIPVMGGTALHPTSATNGCVQPVMFPKVTSARYHNAPMESSIFFGYSINPNDFEEALHVDPTNVASHGCIHVQRKYEKVLYGFIRDNLQSRKTDIGFANFGTGTVPANVCVNVTVGQ